MESFEVRCKYGRNTEALDQQQENFSRIPYIAEAPNFPKNNLNNDFVKFHRYNDEWELGICIKPNLRQSLYG